MLPDEITVILVDENFNIHLTDPPDKFLYVDFLPVINIPLILELEETIIVDLKSMGIDNETVPQKYGKIARIFLFTKSVLGRKKTFGRSAFVINNNIQTSGIKVVPPEKDNPVSLPLVFGKSVSGYKSRTTGKISFNIIDAISTAGRSYVGILDFYGDGPYGADTYGTIEVTTAISMLIGFGATTSGIGISTTKETEVAEISLASHGIPSTRTDHSIEIRARTISGSTGVIKAILYEGAINRSGELTTTTLNNTLNNYTLPISDVVAAAITDYSNLSIKVWGYDSGGNALVFEIAELYLKLPPAAEGGTTYYGSFSSNIIFTKSVAGNVTTKQTEIAEISLASHGTPSVRTNHSIKIKARIVSGNNGVIKAALYEGTNNRSGVLITTPLTNVLTTYTLVISDSAAATITNYSNLSIKFWGFDLLGNALVFEVSEISLELPAA
jgi:hypothetical protein